MTEAFQAAINLARDFAVRVIEAVHHIIDRSPLVRDIEILHRHQFGNGETVMNFKHADLFTWLGNASFLIGTVRRRPGGYKMAAVPRVMLRFPTVGCRKLQRLHGNQVCLAEGFRNLRRCNDRTGRPVTHAAAIKEAKGLRNHRSIHDFVFVNLVAKMGFGVLGSVIMALDRDMSHRPFHVILADAMLC